MMMRERDRQLHLVIYQWFLSRATYRKYIDIPPEASRVKCLAQ